MEHLDINNTRNADASIGTVPTRNKDMSLEKLANTFRQLVTTAGTTFDAGLSSLSQQAGISGVAKLIDAGQPVDDYRNTRDHIDNQSKNSHATDQSDHRDDLDPRHDDLRRPEARDAGGPEARDTTSNDYRDDGSAHNNSSEQAPRNNDDSNNSSQSDKSSDQGPSKPQNGEADGLGQQEVNGNANSINQATANNGNGTTQQAAVLGANASIEVGNSVATTLRGEIGKSIGNAHAGPNAKLANVGPLEGNNGTAGQGAQTNSHAGPQSNTANAGISAQAQGQAVANAQVGNTAQQQAQQIAKSLNPADKVKINVTVNAEAETLTSKPSNSLVAGTILAGANGKSTNQTGEQNSNGQATNGQTANGQAPSLAAIAQQAQATQNQNQQNNNQNNQTQTLIPASTGGKAASGAAQAAQGGGASHVGGAEATTGGASAAANGGTQQTQQTQQSPQAQNIQANQKPTTGSSVVDQVSVKISKAMQAGNDRISIQLKPAELGRIDVKMELTHDGRVMAVVTADNKDTLDLLRRDSGDLQKALENAGMQMDSGDMTFNLRGEENQMDSQGNGRADGTNEEDGIMDADLDNSILAQDTDVISDARVDVRA